MLTLVTLQYLSIHLNRLVRPYNTTRVRLYSLCIVYFDTHPYIPSLIQPIQVNQLLHNLNHPIPSPTSRPQRRIINACLQRFI